jgi:hypothetical protein
VVVHDPYTDADDSAWSDEHGAEEEGDGGGDTISYPIPELGVARSGALARSRSVRSRTSYEHRMVSSLG